MSTTIDLAAPATRQLRKVDRAALREAALKAPKALRTLSTVKAGETYGHLADNGVLTYRTATVSAVAVDEAAEFLAYDDLRKAAKKAAPKPWMLTVERVSKGQRTLVSETELASPSAGVSRLVTLARTFGMGIKPKHEAMLRDGGTVKLPGGTHVTLARVAEDFVAPCVEEWADDTDAREDGGIAVYEHATVVEARKAARKAAREAAKAAESK